MSAMRKIIVSVATLFLGLSAMFTVTATAAADTQPAFTSCEDDWHVPCP